MLIKERFRRTVSYDDFTLRFSREDHSAEFNLIREVCRTQERPFYYIYACVSNRNVDKFVVVHLNKLMQYIRRGTISLEDLQPYRSRIRNNQFFPGMIENADRSSVFLTFSVPALVSICPECLVAQEGFL